MSIPPASQLAHSTQELPELSVVPSGKRIPELDGIRGLAILLVLVWHYVAIGVPVDPNSAVFRVVFYLRNTWAGVDLFFVLSGFLIGGILLDAKSSPRFFSTFYIRRVARILPLYFVLLLTLHAAVWMTEKGYTSVFAYLIERRGPAWSYWLLLQNLWSAVTGEWGALWMGATWSLAVEEQFYLTLPLLIWLTPKRVLPWVIGGMVIATPLLRTALYYGYEHGPFATYWLMPCRVDALGLGVLGALIVRSEKWNGIFREYRSILLGLFAIGLSATVYLTMNGQGVGAEQMGTWGHTGLAVFFFSLLMLAIMFPKGLSARFMRLSPLRRLGITAYGIYLFHYPILGTLHMWLLGAPPSIMGFYPVLVTLLALATTIGFAELSWRFFEYPLVRWGHRFKY